MVVIGHPTGSPFSHHAALAYYEEQRLAAFVTAWFPTATQLAVLRRVPGLRGYTERLSRRRFEPLARAVVVDDFWSEVPRLMQRILRRTGEETLVQRANADLMRTMMRELKRPNVTSVHAYEDCAWGPFNRAKEQGVKCVYDLPIGYAGAWHKLRAELEERYAGWHSPDNHAVVDGALLEQKQAELELADRVVVPSEFVRSTLEKKHADKAVVVPFGSETQLGFQRQPMACGEPLRFLFVGTVSIRKGAPALLEAWEKSKLMELGAELWMVGSWKLRAELKTQLPQGVCYKGIQSSQSLKEIYRQCHVLVFPTFFEGFALVINEALSQGLSVITTLQSGIPQALVDSLAVQLVAAGDSDALAVAMEVNLARKAGWPEISREAQRSVVSQTWENYRQLLRKNTTL